MEKDRIVGSRVRYLPSWDQDRIEPPVDGTISEILDETYVRVILDGTKKPVIIAKRDLSFYMV